MKIIFVGMHNKPGKDALDPTTRTGKIINEIIRRTGLAPQYFRKTNLVNQTSIPSPEEMPWHMANFVERVKPRAGDICILLGTWVRAYFKAPLGTKTIWVRHPSSFIGRTDKEKYIADVETRLWQALDVSKLKKATA